MPSAINAYANFPLPWFMQSVAPVVLTYPRYLYFAGAGANPTEPPLSSFSPTTKLNDGLIATYESAGIGASVPNARVVGVKDFGVNMLLGSLLCTTQTAYVKGAPLTDPEPASRNWEIHSGIDDGAGGIIWTLRVGGLLAYDGTLLPVTTSSISYTFLDISARYVKFVMTLYGSAGMVSGQIRINEFSVTAGSICDTPPKVLNVVGRGVCEGAQITFSWDASPTATAYEYSVNGGTYVSVGNVLTAIFAPATIGTTYNIVVRARNSCGAGVASNPLLVTPCPIPPPVNPPPTPTSFRGLGVCEGTQNTLRWDASVGAHKYYLKINGGSATDIGNVLEYIHTGLTLGATYSYEIAAWSPAGYSAYSAPLVIIPCSPPPPPPPDAGFSINAYGHCMGPKVILWISPTTGGETYEIWRESDMFPTGNGELVYSGPLPTDEAPFTDEPVPLGVTLRYKARAINPGGSTAFTGKIPITPCADFCDDAFIVTSCCDGGGCCGGDCHCTADEHCDDEQCPVLIYQSASSSDPDAPVTVIEGDSGGGSSGSGHVH